MNVARQILQFGMTRPFAPALVDGPQTVTYGELADSSGAPPLIWPL